MATRGGEENYLGCMQSFLCMQSFYLHTEHYGGCYGKPQLSMAQTLGRSNFLQPALVPGYWGPWNLHKTYLPHSGTLDANATTSTLSTDSIFPHNSQHPHTRTYLSFFFAIASTITFKLAG